MDGEQATPTTLNDLKIGMELRGTVKKLELYGAFVDIGVSQDALLHISQLGRPNVRNVEDVVKEGEQITVYVLKVDRQAGRVALSLTKPPDVTLDDLKDGMVVNGTVVRVENYGVFVDIGAERPGMIHVSELASRYVSSPSDVVKVGDQVEARIIKINRKKRQIDMSMKAAEAPIEVVADEPKENLPTAMELALRRAMSGSEEVKEEPRGKTPKRDKRSKVSQEQEDIMARTLRQHSNTK
jgi:ribosomal protein S1